MSDPHPHEIFWDRRLTMRCHPRTRLALRRLVSRLALDGGLKFRGEAATQEAIVNATWLAIEEMPLADAAGWLNPYLSRLEALPGEDASDASGGLPMVATPASDSGESVNGPLVRPPAQPRRRGRNG